jgi:ankyrin repeat protein
VELLLADNAEVNTKDNDGHEPLYYAEYHNQGGQVSALLRQHGGRDSFGEIYDAVVQGDLGKVKALINENPELVRTEVHSGQTPLHWAASYGHKHISELLLGHKADANARARHGVRPLDNAASFGHKGVAVLLLANGADVNAKNNRGETPLHDVANYEGRKDVNDLAELLLANGADVNSKDDNGQTPLHRAAVGAQKGMVELLLAHKAEVNAKSKEGWTPLNMARHFGRNAVVELLRRHGGHE